MWWVDPGWMPDGCPAALSFLFLKWTGLENKMERLTGWEKDREIALRLLSQANKLNSGKINWITFQLELDGDQQGLHQLPSVPLFPRLNITPSFPNPLPLPNWNKGGSRALWSICNSSPLQLLLHHNLPPQYSVFFFFFPLATILHDKPAPILTPHGHQSFQEISTHCDVGPSIGCSTDICSTILFPAVPWAYNCSTAPYHLHTLLKMLIGSLTALMVRHLTLTPLCSLAFSLERPKSYLSLNRDHNAL